MKKKKYLVYFAIGLCRCNGTSLSSDNSYPVYAYGLDGACMEAFEMEGRFEHIAEYIVDDNGNKYTFEINIKTKKIK